jgi:CDP-glycerol glycerophosphotransferase
LPKGANRFRTWRWAINAEHDGKSTPVHFSGHQSDFETKDALSKNLRLSVDTHGRLLCHENIQHAIVTAIDVAPDNSFFAVRGFASLPGNTTPQFALSSSNRLWTPEHLDYDYTTSAFTARFSLSASTSTGEVIPLPADGWSLRLLGKRKTPTRSMWVPVATTRTSDIAGRYLEWFENNRCAFRFTITTRARALWVNTRPPLGPAFGRRKQRELQESIPNLLRSPLRDAVLFSSYNGKSASDSPLELYRELQRRNMDMELIWAVSDYRSEVPSGSRTVLVNSVEYYEHLHTSKFLVNNNNFPHYYSKHPDQVYLQTWHGTPLKRIGNDVPAANLSLSYRALMQREATAWNFLLAQNEFAAETLPRAFGFHRDVLTLGYPRNDRLKKPSPGIGDAVRHRVGVRPDQRVVLYAPTWRDNARAASGEYAFVNYLDLNTISTAFGHDAVLLVRGHSNTRGLSNAGGRPNIIDVSNYPDVTELMLISDALVTDYSSIMFDFIVTGRPILFLVPDIEQYAGTTRGFYFDFAESAPGPLHSTTGEVLRSLDSLNRIAAAYRLRYEAFQRRFAPYDDGGATARVVDAVWGA